MQDIINNDCLLEMKKMENNSVDFIVTDPPYGLKFMGKAWDHGIPGKEYWEEMLRISKPGSMLAAFGGARTFHRLTCAIEDAGWEIRDCISWLYGSGFPKSLNISKSIDKDNGKKRNANKFCQYFDNLCKELNISNKQIDDFLGLSKGSFHFRAWDTKDPRFPRKEFYYKLKTWLPISDEFDEIIEEAEREIIRTENRKNSPSGIVRCGRNLIDVERKITLPKTELANKIDGYGTCLKPAWEPIIIAMKTLDGTYAQNVEKWGLGGINIDECRIDSIPRSTHSEGNYKGKDKNGNIYNLGYKEGYFSSSASKRWPANLILDEESSKILDEQSGMSKSGSGQSRFFYCAKSSPKERGKNNTHPTVKPLSLMKYIIKLLAPPNNPTLLDPFCGSGSTLIAAKEMGIGYIGIEKETYYFSIAINRLKTEA